MSGSILPAAFAAQSVAKPASNNPLTQTDADFAAIEDYLLKNEIAK